MTNLFERATFRPAYKLMLVAATVIMGATFASAQEATTAWATQGAKTDASVTAKSAAAKPNAPVFTAYRGVNVGLTVDEVRQKLGKPEEKFDDMDLFVVSDKERASVYYDKEKKTRAISITYLGTGGSAPIPLDVLGTEIEAKEDGSMHQLIRYPDAGYWVSYSRTAGESPLVLITMQRVP